jgi:LmbE family N-acetylglucosaminyl deacetylase
VYPDARNEFAFPELMAEGYQPHAVPEVWIMAGRINHWVDITDTFERKMSALRSHVSQLTDNDAMVERIRAWGAMNAKEGGLAEGRLAEAFHVMSTA